LARLAAPSSPVGCVRSAGFSSPSHAGCVAGPTAGQVPPVARRAAPGRLGPREGGAPMTPEIILSCLAALGVGLTAGYVSARLQDRWQLTSAQARIAEFHQQAKQQADNLLKEAELKAKDELFKKREDFTREVEQAWVEQREHERRLEKREDTLDQ